MIPTYKFTVKELANFMVQYEGTSPFDQCNNAPWDTTFLEQKLESDLTVNHSDKLL